MTVDLPYQFKPRPYQLGFWNAVKEKKRAIWIVHRRGGKDKTMWNRLIIKAIRKKGTYFYFFPTYSQGKKALWNAIDKDGMRVLDHIPRDLIRKKNDTEMLIELVNGSMIQIIGNENIDRIVGTNPIGVVFSEYAITSPKAWDYIRPILAENKGFAWFNTTPRGRNHAWKLLQQAKNDEDWFWEIIPVSKTHAIDQRELDKEKVTMPSDLYEQEYECKFIEGAGQFFTGIDRNIWSGDLSPEYGKSYSVGVDLAKFQDFTGITPLDHHTGCIGKPERFNQVDYNLQQSKIEAYARRYNDAKVIIDSTGVGEPVFDNLSSLGVIVEPFRFTVRTRSDLLNNLRILIETDKIKLPNDPILLDELRSMQYTLTERGRIKVEVPEGTHDDMIMSCALACWGFEQPLGDPTFEDDEEVGLYSQDFS